MKKSLVASFSFLALFFPFVSFAASPLKYHLPKGFRSELQSSHIVFQIDDLVGANSECGGANNANYYKNLQKKVKKQDHQFTYRFIKKNAPKQDQGYLITIWPNRFGYKTVNQFKADFDICAAGAQRYPFLVNDRYVAFQSSCGSGGPDEDGAAGRCQDAKVALQGKLSLSK